MKKIFSKSLLSLIAATLFLSTLPSNTNASEYIEPNETDQLDNEVFSNVNINYNEIDVVEETQVLTLEVDTELEAKTKIELDYANNVGKLSGTWVDEYGIEQEGSYDISIVNEDWILVDPETNESFTISDTQISASVWWVPVLILVARVGKIASKINKSKIDDAMKFIPKNTVKVSDSHLKKLVGDVHDFKEGYIPGDSKLSHWNVYKDKDTGRLWLFETQGKKRKIPTYEFDK